MEEAEEKERVSPAPLQAMAPVCRPGLVPEPLSLAWSGQHSPKPPQGPHLEKHQLLALSMG